MMRGNIVFRHVATWTSQPAVIGLVLGSVALGALASSPAASASFESQCSPPVVGAPYSYKAVGGKQLSGTKYQMLVINEACSAARAWVAKLTHASPGTHTADGASKISGGPSGWSCEGKGYTHTTHKPPTISGECYQGKLINPTKYFYWKPSVS